MFVSAATSVKWSSDLTPSQMRYVTQHQCLTDSDRLVSVMVASHGHKPFFFHSRRTYSTASFPGSQFCGEKGEKAWERGYTVVRNWTSVS